MVLRYRSHLESRQLAPGTINLRLGAVRRLAYEATYCGLLQRRFGSRYSSREKGEEAGHSPRKLVSRRATGSLIHADRNVYSLLIVHTTHLDDSAVVVVHRQKTISTFRVARVKERPG